jgi:peptidyl-prolyl cis-trans isomerase SurA
MNTRIFSILAIGFLGFTANTVRAAPILVDQLEATINSSILLNSDLKKFRDAHELRIQIDSLYAGTSLATKGSAATDAEIISFLIDEKLIQQQFAVTDAEVEQQVTSIQSNLKVNRDGLKSMLKSQGFSYEEYFDLMRASISKKMLVDREIQTKVHISDDDIKNYFLNHYSKSADGRSYHLAIITLTPSNYKSPAAAREVADRALKELKGGESFEEVAKRTSDDPSAQNGGDLGLLTESQVSPIIKNQIKTLKIGQFSEVLGNAQASYFIIKLIDVKSGDEEQLKKLSEEIRSQLAIGEYQRQIQLWVERQRQNAYIHTVGQPILLKQ